MGLTPHGTDGEVHTLFCRSGNGAGSPLPLSYVARLVILPVHVRTAPGNLRHRCKHSFFRVGCLRAFSGQIDALFGRSMVPIAAPFRVGCLRALPGGLTVISFTGSPVTVIPSFTGSPVPAPFRRRWLAYSSRAGCPLFGRSPGPLSPLPFPRRSFPFPYQLQRTEEFGIGRSRVAVEIFLVHRMVRSKFPAFLRVVGVK